MSASILTESFNAWEMLAKYEQETFSDKMQHGAAAVFVGNMRDHNEGETVISMELEHYPAMTEKYLKTLVEKAVQQWRLLDILIIHRAGKIFPGENIVIVAAWSAHRAEAFTACRNVMEELKHTAPFWKKETLVDGRQRWVEKNTAGEL